MLTNVDYYFPFVKSSWVDILFWSPSPTIYLLTALILTLMTTINHFLPGPAPYLVTIIAVLEIVLCKTFIDLLFLALGWGLLVFCDYNIKKTVNENFYFIVIFEIDFKCLFVGHICLCMYVNEDIQTTYRYFNW